MLAVIFEPIGFNWQISIALVPGLAAREVAVAAGAPSLLIFRLRSGRQRPVHYQAHVRLIDAHPECAGGHHHTDVVTQESAELY